MFCFVASNCQSILICSTFIPALAKNSNPEESLYGSIYTTLLIPDCKTSLLHSLQGESVIYKVDPEAFCVDLATFIIALASA